MAAPATYSFCSESFYASYTSGNAQDPVIINYPQPGMTVGVQLTISSGNGKVQATLDPVSMVINGTATYVDWPAGAVAATTQDGFEIIPTALRCYRALGTVNMSVAVR